MDKVMTRRVRRPGGSAHGPGGGAGHRTDGGGRGPGSGAGRGPGSGGGRGPESGGRGPGGPGRPPGRRDGRRPLAPRRAPGRGAEAGGAEGRGAAAGGAAAGGGARTPAGITRSGEPGPAPAGGTRAFADAADPAGTTGVAGAADAAGAGDAGDVADVFTGLFADRLLAVLSGQRPVHWMLGHTAGRAYDELAWLAERSPLRAAGPRPVVRSIGWYRPRADAVEAFARIALGRRLRALAFRLECGRDQRWRCTAVELGGPETRRPADAP